MLHLYLKAFHIIGFVAWFGGLFYLVRMFVYIAESDQKPDFRAQLVLMADRAFSIICNPAMAIAWSFGIAMLVNTPSFLSQPWLHLKLLLLACLTAYHIACGQNIKRIKNGQTPFTSFQYRLLNELPTLFLVAIVLLAVAKNLLNFVYLLAGVFVFGFVLYLFAKAYKNLRKDN